MIDVLVPCLGGAGEVVKTAKGIDKAADVVDDEHDSAKAMSEQVNCYFWVSFTVENVYVISAKDMLTSLLEELQNYE